MHFEDYATKVKKVFYDQAASYIKTKSAAKIKNKIEYMERKYKSLKQKMGDSGFGVEETDPPTVRERIVKEFPYYYDLDGFMGSRHNVQPPCLIDTGSQIAEEQESVDDSEVPSSQESSKTNTSEEPPDIDEEKEKKKPRRSPASSSVQ